MWSFGPLLHGSNYLFWLKKNVTLLKILLFIFEDVGVVIDIFICFKQKCIKYQKKPSKMWLIYCLLSKILITIYSWIYQISVKISNLPPVVCRRAHVLHTLFVFVCVRIVVSNTYCVAFLFCLSSFCVPYIFSFSRFLITPLIISNVYFLKHIQPIQVVSTDVGV